MLAPALERLPASHVKQVVEPGLLAYFPAMHAAQNSDDDAQRELEDVPAGQSVQTVSLEAPIAMEYLPDVQPTQRVAFGSGLNVPAGHDRQEEKEGAASWSLYL